MATEFDDIELAGLTEAELAELSEFIDPDVSTWVQPTLGPIRWIKSDPVYTASAPPPFKFCG